MTVPNLLTVSRILLTPVIGYLVVHESFYMALGIFTFAGVTDLVSDITDFDFCLPTCIDNTILKDKVYL